ncbi:MAG TPA: alpha/beta hydrolase, partial [Thermoanaerobaculia bacterium]
MKTRSLLLATALGFALASEAAAAGPYQIIGTAETRTGNLIRTEYTVKVGAHPLDRFKMVRVVKASPASQLRGSILFLPPLGSTFSFYEQRDGSGSGGRSIAEFFALKGFDVYGYSPRFEGIPAGVCEAGLADCSVMGTWNIASMVEDIDFIRSQIELLHPGTKIVTGGASLGGMLAVAVGNAHPDDWDGLIVWEGILFSQDPQVRAMNQGYCAALEAQLAAGAVYDGVGVNVFREVTKLARLNPDGLTPIPLFPPNLTNHQVMVLLLSVPSPGPITMPVPNYIQMNGSLAEDRLFHASEPRVYENISRFNSYAPTVLVRDVSCSLAGIETGYVSNLGNYHGAVLAIGGGRGFGPYMPDQLALFGTADKVLRLQPDFGHIDHFMTPRHRDFVERPIF